MRFVEPDYDSIFNQANAKVHVSVDDDRTLCGRNIILWRKKEFEDFLLHGCKRCLAKVYKDAEQHARLEFRPVLSLMGVNGDETQ